MYAIIYFNYTGKKAELNRQKESVERILQKYEDITLVDVVVPTTEWNLSAIYKFKNLQTFLEFQKEIRQELPSAQPRKLELFVDIDALY